MNALELRNASLEDIIFDGRNKTYGAYELRTNYNKRLKIALIITFMIPVFYIIYAKVFDKKIEVSRVKVITIPDTVDVEIIDELKKETPPPPKKEIVETPKIQQNQYTTPKIVEKSKPIATTDELKKGDISTITTKGNENLFNNQPIDTTSTKSSTKDLIEKKIEESKIETPHTKVDVQAKFSGDWSVFLTKKIESLLDEEEAQDVVVRVRFVIDVDGGISQVIALNGSESLKKVAVQAILSSDKKWVPAEINGKPVKAYRLQPIRFQANE
jgi:protein TonB